MRWFNAGRFPICVAICAMLMTTGCQDLGFTETPVNETATVSDPWPEPASKGTATDSGSGFAMTPPVDPPATAPLSREQLLQQFATIPSTERTDELLAGLAGAEPILEQVTELDLRSSKISRSGHELLSQFPNLLRLDLTNTSIVGVDWQPISSLVQLEWLSAEASGLTDASLPFLAPLTRLKHLNAAGTQITDAPFEHLSTLSQLEELNLTGMKQLEDLQLADCQGVSNTTLQRMKAHRQLTTLDLNGTACTPEGVLAWKKLVPDCSVTLGGMTY